MIKRLISPINRLIELFNAAKIQKNIILQEYLNNAIGEKNK